MQVNLAPDIPLLVNTPSLYNDQASVPGKHYSARRIFGRLHACPYVQTLSSHGANGRCARAPLFVHAGRMTHFGTSAPLDIIFVTQINDSSKGPV